MIKKNQITLMKAALMLCIIVGLMALIGGISQAKAKSILVDASRDGGVWWFPQAGPFNPDQPHQGKALADYLKSIGYNVTELPRPTIITPALLAPFDIVIRSNEFGAYTLQEIAAYHDYLQKGGKLLLLSDYKRSSEEDSLGLSFGILFQGISRGENIVDRFNPHPVTQGVSSLSYGVGSGITEFPAAANILGYLSMGTYLDLNDNGVQYPGEPEGAPALGEMAFGKGRIVFSGDTNMWLQVPKPLVDNTINWLISLPIPDIQANGSGGPITLTTSDTLFVTVELVAGGYSGNNADWWVLADTPFGWYHYNAKKKRWVAGLAVTYQGSLFDLAPYKVFNMSSLPIGTYTFYFGVDMIMDGALDPGQLYYDNVVVNITPLNQETCESAGGYWNECGSVCRGNPPGTVCIDVCVSYCECITGSQCPEVYACTEYVDGVGICK